MKELFLALMKSLKEILIALYLWIKTIVVD